MANYVFEVTCKKQIGKIPKGASVQVVTSQSQRPSINEILDAYHRQLGVDTKGISIGSPSVYFDFDKV